MAEADRFREDTAETIEACAEWLTDHADELADEFASGCLGWSITFRAGGDGMFPNVSVTTENSRIRVIEYAHRSDAAE
jgi:hypothetical protein